MRTSNRLDWVTAAASLGGALWMVYGVFEMLTPLGPAQIYQPDLGYELVTRPLLFRVYHLPGSIALMMIALAILGIRSRWNSPRHPWGVSGLLIYLTMGLAILATFGTLILSAPLVVAGLSFGRLAVGAAILLVGVEGRRTRAASPSPTTLLLLGSLGSVLILLQPLVWALGLLPPILAAGTMGLFGLGWCIVGWRVLRTGITA